MITLTSSKIETLAQDDTVIELVEQTGSGVITTGYNTVSEKKRLTARFTVETVEPEYQIELEGGKFFVNIALWLETGIASFFPAGEPECGWAVNLPASITPDATPEAIPMGWYAKGNPYPETSRNGTANLYIYDVDDFAIEITYHNCYDENGYLSSTQKDNIWRFISEQFNEQNTKLIDTSAFAATKDLRLFTYIVNARPDDEIVPYSEQQETILVQNRVSRYDSVIELSDADGNALTQINYYTDTDVRLRFYSSASIDTFYAKLIRLKEDPAYDFTSNLQIQENEIIDSNLTYNVFKGAFDVNYNSYDEYYDLTFSIDKDYLEPNTNYRIIVVGYNSSASYQGISAQITSTTVLPYCLTPCPGTILDPVGLVFTGSITDLHDEYLGNDLTCVIEERLRSKLIIDFSDNRWKNNLDCRVNELGNETLQSNDIRKYLTRVDLEMYETYTGLGGTVKNVVEQKILQRTAPNTYTSTGITHSFDMTAETLTVYYDFRNRNDANTPCLLTFLNGAPYLPVQGNQYWGGKQINIRWSLTFYYHDFAVPYTDTLYFTQRITVKDYSNDVTINNYDKTVFCDSGDFCMEAAIVLASPADYKLIATRQQQAGLLVESEGFVPDNLGQETDSAITFNDTDYTGGRAVFCADGTQLITGQTYKFSAMAKKWL